ncbi:DUF2142 domain-containing protein [Caballeronia concitans]|uniref:DUF2142 domain-containing protein n=1 Tax=Caballeronia concitans TaxID=1777133 RepID=A0A658QZQ3_9BURK|nr:DUF2142 domain-containing protein [Caballeronia concitans]SAL34865.1 hypothetical protein AWB72_03357 [Caballeronia concitans]
MSYLKRFANLARQQLAVFYVCFAVPTGLYLAVVTPPLQTPDAIFHVYRAFQVSDGGIIAKRIGNSSGGEVDSALVDLAKIMFPMATRTDKKYDAAWRARTIGLQWTGHKVDAEFPGSAIYPAYAYLPQAFAFRVGRALNQPVVRTYTLACIFDLLVSVALTAWAIFVARRVALAIFVVGLLPCALMLFSSVSDEVLLIPACFLLIAYADRFQHDNRVLLARNLVAGALLATLCITARPPYVGLLLLAFLPGLRFGVEETPYHPLRRVIAAVGTGLLSVAVTKLFSYTAWIAVTPPRSIPGQIHFLLSHLQSVPHIALATFKVWGAFYWESFVGVLGWLDTHMNTAYYRVAFGSFLLALILPVFELRRITVHSLLNAGVVVLACLACLGMIFGSLYLFWTPVGKDVVEGVQGRYFLGLAPLLALATSMAVARRAEEPVYASDGIQLRAIAIALLMAFPIYSYVEVLKAVLQRFYL